MCYNYLCTALSRDRLSNLKLAVKTNFWWIFPDLYSAEYLGRIFGLFGIRFEPYNNIVVNPFFEGGVFRFFLAPEGLHLIQSEANCGIRAKRGEAWRIVVSNSCLKGPKNLISPENYH